MVWAGENGDGVGGEGVRDDLAHEASGIVLDAFGAGEEDGVVGEGELGELLEDFLEGAGGDDG